MAVTHLNIQKNASKMLYDRIDVLVNYLTAVKKGASLSSARL